MIKSSVPHLDEALAWLEGAEDADPTSSEIYARVQRERLPSETFDDELPTVPRAVTAAPAPANQ